MSRWKIALIALAVIVGGVVVYRLVAGGATQRRSGPGGGADAPVPVTVVPVVREDVPISFDALGTVQALNTVTVKPQVGGQIDSIEFKEGQEIRKGDVIARIDPRPLQAALDQALAKKTQDQAQLGASRATLARYEELIVKHFVAAQDLDNQRQTVRQQEALIAGDDAAIKNARVQLEYATIRAPIDGIAGIRQVDVGNVVQANTTSIVVLTQVHPINVIFTLPEQTLDQVHAVDAEPLKVTALDRTDNHVLTEGTLTVVDNQIDTSTGTYKLKSEFSNVQNTLWPGQFVNVRLQVRVVSGGLVIPSQAVQRGPEGSYVFVVGADKTVAMQPVKLGVEAAEGKVLVVDGLQEGASVVTEGQFRLKPGAKVLDLKPGENAPPPTAEEMKDGGKRQGGRRRGGG